MNCTRCGGLIVWDGETPRCAICGNTRFIAPTPRSLKRGEQQAKGTKNPSRPGAWLRKHAGTLEPSPIQDVSSILDQLKAPFVRQFGESKPFPKIKLPCFFFNQEFRRETGRIVGPLNSTEKTTRRWKKLQRKGKKIENLLPKLIAGLPKQKREKAVRLLWLCDERMRVQVLLADCHIRWFLETIAREQERLETLPSQIEWYPGREDDFPNLHKTITLFPDPSFDHFSTETISLTLFPFPAKVSLQHYKDATRAKLARARDIVEKARACLEPALNFYGNTQSRSRQEANQLLMGIFQAAPSMTTRRAAALAAAFLTVADPQQPINRESLRVKSYLPQKPPR